MYIPAILHIMKQLRMVVEVRDRFRRNYLEQNFLIVSSAFSKHKIRTSVCGMEEMGARGAYP